MGRVAYILITTDPALPAEQIVIFVIALVALEIEIYKYIYMHMKALGRPAYQQDSNLPIICRSS